MVFEWLERRHASLRLRITLGTIVILAIGMALVTLVLVQRAERDTLRSQEQAELSEVTRDASLLSGLVIELQRGLAAAGERLQAPEQLKEAHLVRFLEGETVLRGLFDSLLVLRSDGEVLMRADRAGWEPLHINVSDRDYFRATLAEGRSQVSAPMISRVNEQPIIIVTHPLRKGKVTFGMLCGVLRLTHEELLAKLVDKRDLSDQAMLLISDAKGTIIAANNPKLLMRSISAEPRLAEAYAGWQQIGQPIEPAGLQLPQRGELVSMAGVPGADWIVWRARSQEELLAPLHTARRQALLWAGGIILAITVISMAMLSRLFRPLAQLERRALHLFDHTSSISEGWPVAGGDIGRLSQVLKTVAAERLALESSHNDLLQRLGAVMAATPIGIALICHHRFELVSAEFCRLLGYREAELLDARAECVFVEQDDFVKLERAAATAFQSGHTYLGQWQLLTADGRHIWAELSGSPIDPQHLVAGTTWTVRDISDQKLAQEALEWSAGHDPLTGLSNRRRFEQQVAAVLADPEAVSPAAIVYLDLDHFKPVNDQGGHAAGDAMLVAVAQAIGTAVRTTDVVARLGGDEFAVLLTHCQEAAALRIAETIRAAVTSASVTMGERRFSVGASVGVARHGPHLHSVAAWLAAADAACYAAKGAGRGRVALDSPSSG